MNKKVLIYDPFVLFYFHFLTGLEIALDNIKQGNTVNYLVCKSNLSTCYSNPSRNLNICIPCNSILKNAFEIINLPRENIITLDIKNYRKNIKIPEFKDLEELKNFEIDNVDFGQAVYSSLVNIKREPFPDIDEYKELINKMLIDEIAIYNYAIDLLRNNKYDIVYLFNGRHSTQRPFLRATQKLKVKTFVYEVGPNEKSYTLTEDTYPHDYEYITRQINIAWEKEKDYNKKFQVAENFYLKRLNGNNCPPFHSFTSTQKLGKLPDNFNKEKINIVIFNSSEDEYVGFKEYQNDLYKREVDLFENIFKYTENKNIHYYLRVHPNLKNLNNSQIKSISNLKYDNLTVIPPDSDISTYDLMKVCDKVLVTVSTTGIEANFFGKVVISLGKSFYDKLNVSYKPKTYKELIELIEDRNLKPLSNEGSIKFAWWFENSGIDFKYYEPEKSGGKFLGKEIDYKVTYDELNKIFQKIYYNNFDYLKKQNYLISIIIIISEEINDNTYKSFESVINQSYKNLELLIIDIRNSDINKIDDNLIKKDNRIKYFKYKNISIPKARNKSINFAKGKYLLFLDQGNLLLNNSIELIISRINEKEDLNVIMFGYLKINDNLIDTTSKSGFIAEDKDEQLINQFLYKTLKLNSLLLDKSIFKYEYFDENLFHYSDYDFCNKIIKKFNYLYINIPLYLFLENKELISFSETYFNDIIRYKMLTKITPDKIFSLENDKLIEYLDKELDLFNDFSDKNIIYYDTLLKLIEIVQKFSYSQNRENKKIMLINKNNINLLNMINYSYTNLDIQKVSKDFFNISSKLILIKIFFIKENGILREYYQNTYLNFLLESNHRIISSSWYFNTIPEDIVKYFNSNTDLILVPSQYIYNNLSNLGVDFFKIKVLKEFIDYEIFKPINYEKKQFKFIYTGKITFLSGIDLLIEAFKEEFENDDVSLIIHSDGIYDIEYFENLKSNLNNKNKIEIITNDFSDEELNEFINKSFCFVYPYRSEGSFKNILKCIACNIPIILTDKGISEELPNDLFNKVESEEIEDEEIILSGLNCLGTFSYYEPNKESIKSVMRDIYSNYDSYKEKAIKLREYIIENYNIDKSFKQLNSYISQIKNDLPISDNLQNFKNLLFEKAKKSFENKNYQDSEFYFSRLICYDKNLNYYYYLGLSLYYQERYEEAIDYLSEALFLGLYNYDILKYISDSLYKSGDIENYNYYKEKLLQFK